MILYILCMPVSYSSIFLNFLQMASSFYYSQDRSYWSQFWGHSDTVSVTMVGISGLGKAPGVSAIIAGWHILLYVAPRYRSSSFIVLKNFYEALFPISKTYPSRSLHLPLKLSSSLGSRPWVILPCMFLPL